MRQPPGIAGRFENRLATDSTCSILGNKLQTAQRRHGSSRPISTMLQHSNAKSTNVGSVTKCVAGLHLQLGTDTPPVHFGSW